jgi:hypothetical protein
VLLARKEYMSRNARAMTQKRKRGGKKGEKKKERKQNNAVT